MFCGPQICQKCIGDQGSAPDYWRSSRRSPRFPSRLGRGHPLSNLEPPRRLQCSASVPANVKSCLGLCVCLSICLLVSLSDCMSVYACVFVCLFVCLYLFCWLWWKHYMYLQSINLSHNALCVTTSVAILQHLFLVQQRSHKARATLSATFVAFLCTSIVDKGTYR